MINDNHAPLRDLIHQSLVSDKLTPSTELRAELEQRLDDEVVISPAKPPAETKRRGRFLRAWHVALVVTAALVVMVYFSLPEKWQRADRVISWTFHPQSQQQDWSKAVAAVDSVSAQSKRLSAEYDEKLQRGNHRSEPAGDGEGKGLTSLPGYLISGSEARNKQLTHSIGRESALTIEKSGIEQRESGRGASTTQTAPASGRNGVEDEAPASGFFSNRAVGGAAIDPQGVLPDDKGESKAFSLSSQSQPTKDYDFKFAQGTFKDGSPQYGGFQGGEGGTTVQLPQVRSKEGLAQLSGATIKGTPMPVIAGATYPLASSVTPKIIIQEEEEARLATGMEVARAKKELAAEQAARRSSLSKLRARLSVVGNQATNDKDKVREFAELRQKVKELSDQIADGETRSAEFLSKDFERQQLAQAETEKLLKLTSDLKSMQVQLGPKHPEVLKLTEEINHTAQYVEKLHAAIAIESAPGTEQYDAISDNPFLPVKDAPLSTFSIDVDTASYANVRRFLTQGQAPPVDAVRIEELLNYFSYDYPAPKGDEPFSVNMETAPCPWREEHLLLRVGLRGKEVHKAERPASNLVFLIDTSGSMSDEDKLPLVRQAMSMLTGELGERDRITIVTYAGEAGLKLAPTNGSDRATITSVINSLNSNGSTHGSAGIQMAYEKAREQFIKEGTNRVILCTDGDLNVGITQDDQLVDLISKEAKSGVFLTVLGFGQGNLKDSKMEKLADHGNGIYAYIDGVREAKKVLVDQIAGTLETIAKDVKIQIEFNPAQVRGYRLIGYENRVLAAKDFNDDTKDAGEIGAGHTVTALYELVPAGAAEPRPVVEELKYQRTEVRGQKSEGEEVGGQKSEVGAFSNELLTLKLRYKQPDGDVSKKIEYPLSEKGTQFRAASADFRFAASVAAFGMILRDSPYRGAINMGGVGEIAATSLGDDARGYRAEFLDLVRRAEKLGKR